jgi:hypothetical protein
LTAVTGFGAGAGAIALVALVVEFFAINFTSSSNYYLSFANSFSFASTFCLNSFSLASYSWVISFACLTVIWDASVAFRNLWRFLIGSSFEEVIGFTTSTFAAIVALVEFAFKAYSVFLARTGATFASIVELTFLAYTYLIAWTGADWFLTALVALVVF